ncbi:uncharacterized protein LOC134540947 [Bacillus rossius redtenbacheri]|uniref:uncharacterized protein LOC134540947 n=1 Tax=Bacillus rossius redtenbacheri TaxID=93214 RepID=UPI002FDE4B10
MQGSDHSCGRRISPVLSQEMKLNEGTGSEPSSPAPPVPPGPTPDVDSARKTARKRYRKGSPCARLHRLVARLAVSRKHGARERPCVYVCRRGSLCARLHRLLARQRSQANLWQYELGRPASRGRGDTRSTVLAVRACWRECGRVLLRCERSRAPSDATSSREREEDGDSSAGSSHGDAFNPDIVVIVDQCVAQVPQLEPGSLVRIYPPWQVMEVPQPRVKVVMCLAHLEVVSRGGASEQPTVPLECPGGGGGGEAPPGGKRLLRPADSGARLMRCFFPEHGRGERPPRSQAVGERGSGTDGDRGTVAEAAQLHSCVLSDRVWLLARVHKVFVYRAARYKLNSSPDSEEEIFPQGDRRNLAWSILCRDENNQFCEVELGSFPENWDGSPEDGAGNALSPGRFRGDEPTKRDGSSIHRANEPFVSGMDDISPGNAQVSVGRGTFGKPGEIRPRLSADRNGEPRNLFDVECNDGEIEFHSDGNRPRSENEISLCGGDDGSPGVPGDSPCSCETAAEGRTTSDCKWFWEALASERVQGGVYKLSGLTLVKRITRNKSPGTWALFREAPSLARPRSAPSESEAASADGGSEGGATNLQSMFYVFSTCSEQLQVSSADDPATSFRRTPGSRPPVSLLVDVTEQLRRDSCFRCSLLVKLLLATRGCLYVTDMSLVRQQSAGRRSYVMISICPSCYVPLGAKNGSLLFLRDVLVHGGSLSADRYTRVATEGGESLSPLRGCAPAIPRLQLTSSGGDLVSVSGNVAGVDEETAFAWPACAECGGAALAQLPGGRQLCRRCGRAVATETRMSLAVALACPALPVHSSARVQLLQKTILELLSHTAKSDEGYDLATVLGQEIGPLLCLVERVQIGKSGETNFLLEQVPEIL